MAYGVFIGGTRAACKMSCNSFLRRRKTIRSAAITLCRLLADMILRLKGLRKLPKHTRRWRHTREHDVNQFWRNNCPLTRNEWAHWTAINKKTAPSRQCTEVFSRSLLSNWYGVKYHLYDDDTYSWIYITCYGNQCRCSTSHKLLYTYLL